MSPGRLPDFVVIGAMKSGTTSLFRWLGDHPACALPAIKEPQFFSDDRAWARGIDWYRDLFPPTGTTGEASVAYTSARFAAIAAERLHATIPDARLVCVLREPLDRIRAHYVHERQRGREARPFVDAVDVGSRYVQDSCYDRCLAPWLDDDLLVVRMDDLVGDDAPAWTEVLDHLGLARVGRPSDVHNASESKARFGGIARRLYDAGVRTPPAWLPRPVRSLARAALLRERVADDALASDARTAPLPDDVTALVLDDLAHLERRLGRTLWSTSSS